jgi:exosortase E/protease (VPEID-CTERM system)
MTVLASPSSSARRWTIAGAILIAEYLLISVRFDAGGVLARGGFWGIAGLVGRIAKYVAIVFAAGIMLVPRTRAEASAAPPVSAPALGVHAVLFAAFWQVTNSMFGGREAPAGSATVWFAAWAVLGAGAATALAVALVGTRGLAGIVSARGAAVMVALGAAAWFAGEMTQGLWQRSSGATLRLVTMLLRTVFSGVTADADKMIVTLDGYSVWVAPECSGLEGVGLVTVLMTGYLVALRSKLRFPNALLLLPFSIAAVWFLNGVRLAALIALGARVNESLAGNAFHARAGWVLFCVVALGVSALGRRSRFFSRTAAAAGESENPAAPFLVPLLALIATALVTGMFADPVDRLYGLRVVVASLAIYAYREAYRGYKPDFSIASIGAGVAIAALWLASAAKNPDAATTMRQAFADGPPSAFALWVVFRCIGSVILVPICEELAFRGYLLRRLVDKDFSSVDVRTMTPLALAGSSIAFGLVHERWLVASLAGAAYALVAVRRGNLSAAIVAHAVSNALIAAWVLATGDYSQWS